MRVTSTKEEHLFTLSHSQLKTFLFGPVEDVTGSIIKKVTVGYLADTTLGAERDITYTVTPRSRQGLRWRRNNICLRQHRSHHTDHSCWRFFRSRGWTYIYVDQEEMFISKIDGNTLTVKESQDNSKAGSTCLWASSP